MSASVCLRVRRVSLDTQVPVTADELLLAASLVSSGILTHHGRLDAWQLAYYTDTMQCSSGSPVCNDRWQVVALHRAWEYANQLMFQGKPTAWRNIGVRIDRLIEHLQQ